MMDKNSNGNNFEDIIENTIKKRYVFIANKDFNSYLKQKKPIYTKQFYIGNNIYGKKRICDFVLFHPKKHKNLLIIECKWQQSKGSVDEKYPFLLENIKQSRKKTYIVIDGGGYKKAALIWLKKNHKNTFLLKEYLIKINKNKDFL